MFPIMALAVLPGVGKHSLLQDDRRGADDAGRVARAITALQPLRNLPDALPGKQLRRRSEEGEEGLLLCNYTNEVLKLSGAGAV
jgi:hypothetical protein